VVDKVALGAGFLRVLRFPLPILIPLTAPHSWSIIRGWYNRPLSGRRTKWTQSHPIPRNLKKKQTASQSTYTLAIISINCNQIIFETASELTDSVYQGHSWEANSHSADQEITNVLRNFKVLYDVYKRLAWPTIWAKSMWSTNSYISLRVVLTLTFHPWLRLAGGVFPLDSSPKGK
jgi:hypothetical protein